MSYYLKPEKVKELLKERIAEYDLSTPDKKDTGAIYRTKNGMYIGNANDAWSSVVDKPYELEDWFIDGDYKRYPFVIRMIDEAANVG